ncbi:class I adenylate-forming enzyme family protein [Paraburkholderia xenovorans]|nr:AMP-binding protein [Paraburkholderia xenovorans]
MFRAVVARAADAEALVDGTTRLSYRELDRQVDRLADALAAAGIQAGDRIAVMLSNRLEAVLCVLAIARAQGILVPIGERLRAPEVAHILQDSQAIALVYQETCEPQLPPAEATPLCAARFCCGTSRCGNPAFEQLLATRAQVQQLPVLTGTVEDDIFGILYTSGTTGRPKGATLTHLNVIHSCLHWVDRLGLVQEGERSVLCIPWSHVAGLCGVVFPLLYLGGALVLVKEFNKRTFLRLASEERMSHALLVPAMYGLCLLDPDLRSFDLSAWRIGVYGSAPMPEATIRRFAEAVPHLVMCNAYGATETASPATIMPPGDGLDQSDSIGKVVACGEIRVMDENGCEMPPGEPGELWIRGPMIASGYWRNPEATESAFVAGFWKSGDIGSVDSQGYVRIADRKKDMINRGGFKIYPAEVENVLCELGGVLEVAVVGRPHVILGETVVAFVRCVDVDVTDAIVREFCSEKLADYKIPDHVVIVEEPLPRNPNGKMQKEMLREMARALP